MGYTLKDFSIVWTDNGAELKFKSPYQVQDVPLPGPVVKMEYGMTRSSILQYYKTFDYNIQVTVSNEVIPTVLNPSPTVFDQVLADPLTGELIIDEFGMNVYTVAEFTKNPPQLKDLRYD
jgi:hypothetical protein